MSEKQKMCTVMDLPTSILASLFTALVFAGFHNQFPLLTMPSKTFKRFELSTIHVRLILVFEK